MVPGNVPNIYQELTRIPRFWIQPLGLLIMFNLAFDLKKGFIWGKAINPNPPLDAGFGALSQCSARFRPTRLGPYTKNYATCCIRY